MTKQKVTPMLKGSKATRPYAPRGPKGVGRARHTIKGEPTRAGKRCRCGAPLFRNVTCLRCEPDLMALFVLCLEGPDRTHVNEQERQLLITWDYLQEPAEVA